MGCQNYCFSGRHWTVRKGENLWRIAELTYGTVAELKRLNPGIDPHHLQPGQHVCLPPARPLGPTFYCRTGVYWSVAPADTLESIAKATGYYVSQLITLNPWIDPHYLVPGSCLCLPR